MMTNLPLYIFLIFVLIGVVSRFIVAKRRHKEDYREYLEPILSKNNMQYISSVFPGWFNVGPFPKVETELGRPQSQVSFLGRGEYSQYRVVTVSDSEGHMYKIWALLDFEVFKLRRVRWRVEEGQSVPGEANKMIEL